MNDLETYFRAFLEYTKRTGANRDCEKLRKTFERADTDNDILEVVKTDCIIEDDWIEAIERGLVCIEKAIAQERQFIRSEGEVVPIEKVKQVSRESVEHLAKHSNLLTKVTEGEDLVPDKLFTVERLTDYAVYENRFLYMLLCFLRDFVSYRYGKICELTNTYRGALKIKKTAHGGGRTVTCELSLSDVVKNDAYLAAQNPAKDKIERIDIILKTVLNYLATPLMEFVSKSPMLKPPITETNVLKLNKDFKGAKELYYFLSAYDKDGFTVETHTETISPFPESISADFAESAALATFLEYEHGLGIEDELKKAYEQQLAREREQEKEQLKQKIESLRRRIKDAGGAEEYMLLLEQRNRELEDDAARLVQAEEEIKKLNAQAVKLGEEIQSLTVTVAERDGEIANLKTEHAREIAELNETREREIAEINLKHAEEIMSLAEAHREKIEQLNAEYSGQIENLNAEHSREVETLNERHAERERGLKEQIDSKSAEITRQKAEFEQLKKSDEGKLVAAQTELEKLQDEKRFIEGRLNALRSEHGLISKDEDFSAQAEFDELEHQYKAFKKFFKEEWRGAKKRIRQEVLKPKPQHEEEESGGDIPQANNENQTENIED